MDMNSKAGGENLKLARFIVTAVDLIFDVIAEIYIKRKK